MRTTVRLPDELMRQVKKLAADTDRSMTRVIEDALREAIARTEEGGRRRRVRLTTCGKGGTRPGIDLDDSRALRERMDGSGKGAG
jgi:hypothetical protein